MIKTEDNKFTMAVIIPNYGRPELLTRLLDSIKNSDWPDTLIGIWVVENGIRGETESIINNYKTSYPVHYLFFPEPSLSKARNEGIMASNADVCIFFDDDLKIKKHTLVAYEKAIKEHGLKNFYGGPLIPDYESTPEPWLSAYLPASTKGFYFDEGQQYITAPYFLGGNHAVPVEALKRVGLYDFKGASGESNSGYLGEETRLQAKLSELGYKGICVHKAEVYHFVPKENCSYCWLLKRRVRAGMTDADKIKSESVTIMGVPRWVIQAYFKNLLKTWLGKLTLKQKKLIAPSELKVYYYKGVLLKCLGIYS